MRARAPLVAVTFACACAFVGCARATPHRAAPPANEWDFDVDADAAMKSIAIHARFPAGSGDRLIIDRDGGAFVEGLVVDDVASREIETDVFSAEGCVDGCDVRYVFRLSDAADALSEPDVADRHGEAVVTTPSGFLLRPSEANEGVRYRLRVRTGAGASFVTSLPVDSDGAYVGDADTLGESPFSAFGAIDRRSIAVGASQVDVALAHDAFDDATVLRWADRSADVVAHYYSGFPIGRALVLVVPVDGDDIGFGQATGGGGATILARVGRQTSKTTFDDDWVLPHEMVHLGMPYVARRQHWWVEGVATYVEPIARARMGITPRTEPWREFVQGMPKGLPKPGDHGLDHTPTWGRTYWGGALFCLLADVEIRKKSNGTRSLDDALRGVVAAGGNIRVGWPLERVFDVGDRATGTDVLTALHAKMADAPVDVDLEALWASLGVVHHDGEITFDDAAPLAAIRRAITLEAGSPP